MRQKDKNLLLTVLCAELPYGLSYNFTPAGEGYDYTLRKISVDSVDDAFPIDEVKPYLRPMSSMTEEEKLIREKLRHEVVEHLLIDRLVDFYNSRHLDWRGLILMDLALEAPEGMYKTE